VTLLLSIFTALLLLTSCSSTTPSSLDASTTQANTTKQKIINNITVLLQESKKINSSPAIAILIKKSEENSNAPEPLYDLAYAHLKHAQATQNMAEYNLAKNYFSETLLLVPGNLAVIGALYNIYYDDTLHDRNANAFQTAKDYFLQMPESVQETMNPPSLAKFIATAIKQDTQHQPNHQMLREILLQAIQEQPKNDSAYIQLAKIYTEDHYFTLAIATLKLGAENITDSAELYKAIALTYEKRANVNNCSYENPKDIANATKYYKLAIPLAPDNQELHYNLSGSLLDQHQNLLGLNESSIALELNPTSTTLSITAQDYSILGYTKNANALLELALNKGLATSETSYHEINMNLGDWEKAANGFSAYVKTHNSFTVYDLIKSDIIAQQSQQQPWLTQNKITFNNKWEESLLNYWTDNISADALKKMAHNSCEKTEYYFYSGYKDLYNDQTAQAKIKFAEALDQNTYRFIERPLARNFLKK